MPKKFQQGTIVATPAALEEFSKEILATCLFRHLAGDWGNLSEFDSKANEDALVSGERLFSSYIIDGKKLWIITEADRSSTTLLLPEDY